MGEFEMAPSLSFTADDLAEALLKQADNSGVDAEVALSEFTAGVRERLTELVVLRDLVTGLKVTDEHFAEFGKRVAADMGSLKRWDDATVADSASRHAQSVFRDSSPTLPPNGKRWEAFKRLNEL